MKFLAALFLIQVLAGQTSSVLVRTDLECRWSVDGEPRGVLKAGDQIHLSLAPGEHRVEATPLAGGARWQGTVKLDAAADEQVLVIPLRATVAQSRGYWIDTETKLMWPAADNGSGVSWSQASYYCRGLTLGGFKDWTLPSIDELHKLFGGPADQGGYHITGPAHLTGWEWSATAGQEPGEQWALDFGDGGRASVVMGDSGLNRALCLRHTAE